MSIKRVVCALIVLAFLGAQLTVTFGKSTYLRHEKHVLDWIRQVPREVIPHLDNNEPIVVYHMVSLNRIVDFDIHRQVLELSGWQLSTWVDPRLAWDVEPFIQVDHINVPIDMVWVPDIIIYNRDGPPLRYPQNLARVQKNGTVTVSSPILSKTFCPLPDVIATGDSVKCTIGFGSWNYDLRSIELRPMMSEMVLAVYTDFNKDWKLVESNSTQIRHVYTSPTEFTTVRYSIELQKK